MIKVESISWAQFHLDAILLSDIVRHKRIDAIVALTRGGLVPAAILASELDVRMVDTMCLKSYDDENKGGDVTILKSSTTFFNRPEVLVVDDLADTGATLQAVRRALPLARIAVVYGKPLGIRQVDYVAHHRPQDTWLKFPWEV